MRTWLILALLTCLAYGQKSAPPGIERVFSLLHVESPQVLSRSSTAEWLVNNLDTLPAPQTPGSAVLEYRLSGGPADVARVFYLANIRNPQDLQKIVIAIRENTAIQRLMPVDPRMAIALRCTDAPVVAAQRLVAELDTTASAR
jgi:hypothetical protein